MRLGRQEQPANTQKSASGEGWLLGPLTIKSEPQNEQSQTSTNQDIWQYLLLTFLIAWGTEALIIAGERLGVLTGTLGSRVTFLLIFFGAGFAPAYAVCILLRRQKRISGLKDVLKLALANTHQRAIWIAAIFFGSQLLIDLITEVYLGKWYLFIVGVPVMIIGGGIEELGWRGFLQPRLERRWSFVLSALIAGVIWACWHLPLWLIRGANQSSMNFLSFLCYSITFTFVLALLYRITNCVFACVLLHAWGNTMHGVFTRSALTNPPDVRMAVIWGTEILIVILASFLIDHRRRAAAGVDTLRG